MDSLLANYATSDEEEQEQHQKQDEDQKPKSSLFSSLPPPKSQTLAHLSLPNPNPQIEESKLNKPSLFSSLPPPNPNSQIQVPNLNKPSSLFASLPPPNPNSQFQEPKLVKPSLLFASLPKPTSSSSQFSLLPAPNPKKVVQVKLPVIKPSSFDDDEDDDDREREGRKTESFTQAPSIKSFLSSIPAPKNSTSTLGALPSALGSGRKSILEADVPSSNPSSFITETQVDVISNDGSSSIGAEYGVSSSIENYENYNNYGNYDYTSNWGGGSADVAQSSVVGFGESVMKVPGKRGRNEIPKEIVEVTQDELTKNRPREDQVKSTGIAFGPAYQPVSTKGKPTKLHKRKHQIGSLYFDMKQKEMELAERRSKGFLTKAETQAKYGW